MTNQKVIKCLFSLINQVLKYSTPDATLMALKTTKFMMETLPQNLFKDEQKALYSALLRLLIYQHVPKHSEPIIMKKKLFSFFNFLLEKKIDMGSLRHQFFIYLVILMNSEYKLEQKQKEQKTEEEDDNKEEQDEENEDFIGKKSMQKMSLREVYMEYTINLGNYFGCLLTYLSNWDRKVVNDKSYYPKKPFDDFVNLTIHQNDEIVSEDMKLNIKKMFSK